MFIYIKPVSISLKRCDDELLMYFSRFEMLCFKFRGNNICIDCLPELSQGSLGMSSYWVKLTLLKIFIFISISSVIHHIFLISPAWKLCLSSFSKEKNYLVRTLCWSWKKRTKCIFQPCLIPFTVYDHSNKHKACIVWQICSALSVNCNGSVL